MAFRRKKKWTGHHSKMDCKTRYRKDTSLEDTGCILFILLMLTALLWSIL